MLKLTLYPYRYIYATCPVFRRHGFGSLTLAPRHPGTPWLVVYEQGKDVRPLPWLSVAYRLEAGHKQHKDVRRCPMAIEVLPYCTCIPKMDPHGFFAQYTNLPGCVIAQA
jgi:hypothetical protein